MTSHSDQLSFVPSQRDLKWVPAAGQWQCCTAGMITVGLMLRLPCTTRSMVHPHMGTLTSVDQHLSSGCACWCTDVLTARHRAILVRPSVQFPAIPRDIVSDLPVRQRYWFRRHAARHWATARFLWWQPKPGTLCLIMSGTRLQCSLSVANLKLCCLGSRTRD